jgi:hypothetical protein
MSVTPTASGVRLREFMPDAAVLSPPVPMTPRVTDRWVDL